MPDIDSLTTGTGSPRQPPRAEPYPLKGCAGLDWGMQGSWRVFQ